MKYNYKNLTHHGIQSLKPYIPGKSIEEVAREQGITDIIKLASNENVWGCSEKVIQALQDLSTQNLSLYPASICHPFREQIAKFLNVETEMLTLSNGSDLLICLLLICFALHNDKHILTHDHAFISYQIQAKTLGIPVVSTPTKNWEVDIDAMINACTEKTAMIFLANPNNPTGGLISYEDVKRLIESIPETTILVLDEAYYEYAKADFKGNSIDLVKKHSNMVVIRTFSKAYGLAGLRLGYAISNPQITQLLYSVQLPFAVNIASLTAASVALKDQDFIDKVLSLTNQGLQQMRDGLDNLNIPYLPSSANFITIDCGRDGNDVFDFLQKTGIITRPLHPYNMSNFLRITIGTKEHNERTLSALSREIK
ncbi:MAG: histidinol-phosphate transaminase [Legionellaceae bacterium]|nr:histidinol-phosphate transaminase [Legionellaceae bacterium]